MKKINLDYETKDGFLKFPNSNEEELSTKPSVNASAIQTSKYEDYDAYSKSISLSYDFPSSDNLSQASPSYAGYATFKQDNLNISQNIPDLQKTNNIVSPDKKYLPVSISTNKNHLGITIKQDNDNKWKRLRGTKLKTLSTGKKISAQRRGSMLPQVQTNSFSESLSSPKNTPKQNQLDNDELIVAQEEIKQDPQEKLIDLLGIIGVNFELSKPKNYIRQNVLKTLKKEKEIIKTTYQYDYSKYEPHLFQIMNKVNESIDGFYGDWNRDEFKNGRSIYKLKHYQELGNKKLYNKIFPKLPPEYLQYKIEIEPNQIKKNNEMAPEKMEIFYKRKSKKPDPKRKYKRLTLDEFTQLGKPNPGDGVDNEKKHLEWLKREKLRMQGESLQFPIIDLGNKKYGGIKKDLIKLDEKTARELIESLKQKCDSSDEQEDIVSQIYPKSLHHSLINDIESKNNIPNELKDKIQDDSMRRERVIFSKILKYMNSDDKGVLANKLPLNQMRYDHYKKSNLYNDNHNSIQFDEYQKLNQRVYNHHELETKKSLQNPHREHKKKKEVSPLPIVKNIDNKSFVLIEYYLSSDMAKLLGETLLTKNNLTNIIMVNNKLTDEAAEIFFSKIQSLLHNVVMFRFVKNAIGPKTSKIFIDGLFSKNFNNLRELTLDSCKINDNEIAAIMEKAYSHRARIKYLGLANTHFQKEGLQWLSKLLADDDYLLFLDISWNNLDIQKIVKLMEVIFTNPNIRYVNIAHNTLGSGQSSESKDQEIQQINNQMIVNESNNSLSNESMTGYEAENEQGDSLKVGFAINLLKSTMMIHGNLMHLNLSYTKLVDNEIDELAEGINLSCSLMSVHLTGNYLTYGKLRSISKKLNAKKDRMDDYIRSFSDNALNAYMYLPKEIGQFDFETNQQANNWNSERRISLIELPENEPKNLMKIILHPIIFYRIIDPDISMSYQNWIESQHCWICDRWHKIVINCSLDNNDFVEQVPDPEQKLLGQNDSESTQLSTGLIESNDSKSGPLINNISCPNQIETSLNDKLKVEKTKPIKTEKILRSELEFSINGTFTQGKWLTMKIKLNTKNLEYCDYMPHGLHKYRIQKVNKITQATTILLETEILVGLRNKDIQPYKVKVPGNELIYKKRFQLQRSIFKEFRLDTDSLFERCLEADWKYIKLSKIVKKADELVKIKQSILANYQKIKGIFLLRSAKPKIYPFINWVSLLQLCNDLHIFDDKIGISELDKAFVAVSLERNESGMNDLDINNGTKNLSRYEFIEIMIRLAIIKYYDNDNNNDLCETASEAWDKFYYSHLRKIKSSEIYFDFYRNTKIHTARIDELLKLNIDACEKFYIKHKVASGFEFATMEKIIQNIGLKLSEDDFIYLAAHSKMTPIDEMREGYQRTFFAFTEFLEFIVRLADFIFNKEDILLHIKIELILRKLLALIDEKVICLEESDNDFED